MLYLQSFLRKGVSLGYVGSNYNLKDLKDNDLRACVLGLNPACTLNISCSVDMFFCLETLNPRALAGRWHKAIGVIRSLP